MTTLQEIERDELLPDEPFELLPCPFCGGRAEILRCRSGPPYIAHCIKCPASMSLEWIEEEAAREWNRRTHILAEEQKP